jgi:hypothetical protein
MPCKAEIDETCCFSFLGFSDRLLVSGSSDIISVKELILDDPEVLNEDELLEEDLLDDEILDDEILDDEILDDETEYSDVAR